MFLFNPSTSRLTGNQEGHAKAVQKETEEDEQADSGRAQTGNKCAICLFSPLFIKITPKTMLGFNALSFIKANIKCSENKVFLNIFEL